MNLSGSVRTLRRVQLDWYWPGRTCDVRCLLKAWRLCQSAKVSATASSSHRHKLYACGPWHVVSLDLVDLFTVIKKRQHYHSLSFWSFLQIEGGYCTPQWNGSSGSWCSETQGVLLCRGSRAHPHQPKSTIQEHFILAIVWSLGSGKEPHNSLSPAGYLVDRER